MTEGWNKRGVWDRIFEEGQRIQRVRINIEAVSQDGTVAKVPPAGQTHDVLKRGSLLAEVARRAVGS